MDVLPFREARVKLSAVVKRAAAGQPIVITRRGKKDAVVMSLSDYERLARFQESREADRSRPSDAG